MADPIPTPVVRNSQGKRICTIDGCVKPYAALGFCAAHYRRLRDHGHPLGGSAVRHAPLEALRFLTEVVLPFEGEECLIWPLNRNTHGYASIFLSGKRRGAHRVACEAKNGPPPTPEHHAAHSCGCGHMGCVNPRHLRWATPKQNSADMVSHGKSQRGTRMHAAKLTEASVLEIRALHGTMSYGEIADRFGVSSGCVGKLLRGKNWKWLA